MTLFNRDGKLWITFYHQSKRYRRSLELDDTKANRKLAETKILPELIYKLNSGAFFENEAKQKMPTLGEYAKVSFEMHKFDRKESTRYDYETSFRLHIEPTFGKRRLDSIKPSDIATWQNQLLEKLTPRRVRNIRAVLTGFFSDAMRDELIVKNPVDLVRVPRAERVEVHPFSLDELQRIIRLADGDLKAFCALGFFTGMRSGEMIGLMWDDVDFEKRLIHVRRALKMGKVTSPKTSGSIRSIDMIEPLVPYLEAQFEKTGGQGSFVFLNQEGQNYYDIKRIRNVRWKNLLKKAGLEYRTIYHMRHTFATVMIEHGEDILWVSHMLGHTSATMTLERYAKYTKRPDKKRAAFMGA